MHHGCGLRLPRCYCGLPTFGYTHLLLRLGSIIPSSALPGSWVQDATVGSPPTSYNCVPILRHDSPSDAGELSMGHSSCTALFGSTCSFFLFTAYPSTTAHTPGLQSNLPQYFHLIHSPSSHDGRAKYQALRFFVLLPRHCRTDVAFLESHYTHSFSFTCISEFNGLWSLYCRRKRGLWSEAMRRACT
jgi:hypothetical protein